MILLYYGFSIYLKLSLSSPAGGLLYGKLESGDLTKDKARKAIWEAKATFQAHKLFIFRGMYHFVWKPLGISPSTCVISCIYSMNDFYSFFNIYIAFHTGLGCNDSILINSFTEDDINPVKKFLNRHIKALTTRILMIYNVPERVGI